MGLSRLPRDRSDRDSSGGWVMAVIGALRPSTVSTRAPRRIAVLSG